MSHVFCLPLQQINKNSMDKNSFLKQYAKYALNGHDYVEIAGIKWATKNVGAENETDYGLYFAWGEIQGHTVDELKNDEVLFSASAYKYSMLKDSHQGLMAKYNEEDGKTVLDLSDDAARAYLGGSWRTPTDEEFNSLIKATTHEWIENYKGSGVNGMLFTDKKDKTKKVFFPAAGFCYNGSLDGKGSYGCVWSSTLGSLDVVYGRGLDFYSGYRSMGNGYRRSGFSVRGVCVC